MDCLEIITEYYKPEEYEEIKKHYNPPICEEYDPEKPILCNYYTIMNGKKEGVFTMYHINGNIAKVCNYINGELNGDYHTYYTHGSPNQKCSFINNQRQGLYVSYHSNGKPFNICNYIDGKLDGENKKYDRNGNLVMINYYNNGVKLEE
jgi:antitoxin component YwqK of YwqJK toxin-antitoxin module